MVDCSLQEEINNKKEINQSEFQFEGIDGLSLFGQYWLPYYPPKAILGIVHGIGEHIGRYNNVIKGMLTHQIGVVGFDLRGHGRSQGQRGHIDSWDEYRGDLELFLRWVDEQQFGCPMFLLGHSLGALIVSEFILYHPNNISGVILSGTALDQVGVASPLLVTFAKLLSRVLPTFKIKLNLDTGAITRDRKVIDAYEKDPLVHGITSVRFGTEALAAIKRIKMSAPQVRVPMFMVHGGEDRIISVYGAREYFCNASSSDGKFLNYVDSYHEPHNDLDYDKVVADIAEWIQDLTLRPKSNLSSSAQLVSLSRMYNLDLYPSGWSIETNTLSKRNGSQPTHASQDQAEKSRSAFQRVNSSRIHPGSSSGHYESFFQRANHPYRPLAFWIRYTAFIPKARPENGVGQLWAIYFDGDNNRIYAAKEEFPINECRFAGSRLSVLIGQAFLEDRSLRGSVSRADSSIDWDLTFRGQQAPLFLVPEESHDRKFPAAKALVGLPFAIYNGSLVVNGKEISFDSWVGSQNHNWGSKHTDEYAWGQVAGFDNAPDVFLECVTARLRIGPIWSPWLTNVVLRLGDHDYALNSIRQGLRAKGSFDYFTWSFFTESPEVKISGKIDAPKEYFAGLQYGNPPGGVKTCLNTKLAACQIVVERPGKNSLELHTESRAAFEIITDDDNHGVPIIV